MAERLLEFIKLVINRNGLSGYPVDAFEQSPQKGALCVICKRVASDPMFSIDCGHRYCTKCLAIYFSLYHNPEITYDAVKAAANSIPDDFEPDESVEVQCAECDCGKTLTFSDFNPDRALGKQLARLQCKCPSKGCDFTSLFLPFVDHFQICEYTEVECPYCVHCFARSDLPVHMAKCDHRPELRSVCTYCKLPIATAQMQSHLRDQCIKFPTSCRYCRTVTSRSQLKEHEQDCNLVDRCSIGCDVTEPIAASKHFIDNEALHLPIINEMLSAFKSKSYSALQLELSKPKCTEVQLNETYLELLSELSNMHSESSGLDVASFDPRRSKSQFTSFQDILIIAITRAKLSLQYFLTENFKSETLTLVYFMIIFYRNLLGCDLSACEITTLLRRAMKCHECYSLNWRLWKSESLLNNLETYFCEIPQAVEVLVRRILDFGETNFLFV